MKWRSIRGMSGDEVFHQTAVDIGREILLFGSGFLLILILGLAFPAVGTVGRWFFLLPAALLGLRFVIGCLVGLADSVLEGTEGGGMEGSGWIVFVTGARLLEAGVVFLMVLFLFRRFS